MEQEKQSLIKLEESTNKLIDDILIAEDSDEYKKLIDLFNLNQSKKNIVRIAKLDDLLDKVESQAMERFDKTPGQMSNRDLLDYIQVLQNSIDRSKKYVDEVKAEPMIQVNNVTINNEVSNLDKESRERVIEAVKALIGNLQDQTILPIIDESEEEEIINSESNEEEKL